MEEGLVSVDKFSGGSQAYFLTHLHQDHTRGLGAVGGWRHGPLYCSPTTARLLPIRFPGIDASLLRPLAPGASASIYLFSPSSGQSLSLHVTAIPALHCPGTSPLPIRLLHSFLCTAGTELLIFGWFLRLTRASAQDRSCTSSAETSGACCTRGTSGGSSDAMKRGERSRIYWTRLTGIPLMCSIWTTPTATHRSTSLHAPSSLSRSVSLRHKRGCYANLCLRVMVEFTADDDLIETSFLE
jgi:hypothetical protein